MNKREIDIAALIKEQKEPTAQMRREVFEARMNLLAEVANDSKRGRSEAVSRIWETLVFADQHRENKNFGWVACEQGNAAEEFLARNYLSFG